MRKHDVVVVGYGPVGQTLAILLGQRGRDVVVLERWAAPYPLPRAVHLDHEVARILQSAGIADALARITEPADGYDWRNADGEVLLRFRRRGLGPSGWPESSMFAQPELERVLDARARALRGVDVRRGREATGLEFADDAVTVTARTAEGATESVRGRYVVGCDGANSFVRGTIGVDVVDLGFHFDWLIVDVRPHEPRRWEPLNAQLCDPRRPTTLVSGGPGRRRWEFMRMPHERREDLDRESTAWALLAAWDVTPANATLERHAVYTFQARWARAWRRGRVLLAGDAAHQMPPFAGQGMCSGVRDAANLAWKLDAVLGGHAAEALLDTYGTERAPHVAQTIDLSVELGKIICVTDREAARARDAQMIAAMRAGVSPPPLDPAMGAGCTLAGCPHAGQLVPQGDVVVGGVRGRFDDVVGGGWVLLARDGDPAARLGSGTAAWFAGLGGSTAHVGPDAPVRDVDGRYAAWFERIGAGVVLQRPDFRAFGTGRGAADGDGLLRALRHALEQPATAA